MGCASSKEKEPEGKATEKKAPEEKVTEKQVTEQKLTPPASPKAVGLPAPGRYRSQESTNLLSAVTAEHAELSAEIDAATAEVEQKLKRALTRDEAADLRNQALVARMAGGKILATLSHPVQVQRYLRRME